MGLRSRVLSCPMVPVSPHHRRIAYFMLLLDAVVMAALLLTMYLKDNEYARPEHFHFREDVFELHFVALARCIILAIFYCQGSSIGTMYRAGRDGHSHCQTLVVRILITLIPIASVLLAIIQAAWFDYSVEDGTKPATIITIVAAILMPILELVFGFLAFVRILEEGPDYKFLEMVEGEDSENENTSLMGSFRKQRAQQATLRRASSSRARRGSERSSGGDVPTIAESTVNDRLIARERRQELDSVHRKAKEAVTSSSSTPSRQRTVRQTTRRRPSKRQLLQIEVIGANRMTGDDSDSNMSMSEAEDNFEVDLTLEPEGGTSDESPSEKNQRQRQNVVKEIISTEQSYVRTVKMIIDVFLLPLRQAAEATRRASLPDAAAAAAAMPFDAVPTAPGLDRVCIERGQVKAIFLEVETLYSINNHLLVDLIARYKSWGPDTKIADVFLDLLNFMKAYTTYANNFDNALQTINACKKDPAFVEYLEYCVKNKPECGKMWLDDHLIAPIQRIPRYILLLRELLKKTPDTHPDYNDLCKCVVKMEELAEHVNNSKKRAEKSLMMIMVQRMVKHCPSLVEPARQFINDFPCVELEPLDPDEADQVVTKVRRGTALEERELVAALTAGERRSTNLDDDQKTQAEALAPEFQEKIDIVLYLFNDLLLSATHVRVQGVIGRSKESLRRLRGTDETLRPVTMGEDGSETIHKYKFQRKATLNNITVTDFPDSDMMKNVFVINYPENSVYYKAPSAEEKHLVITSLLMAKEHYEEHRRTSTLTEEPYS